MWGERGVGRRGTWRDVMGLAAPGEGGRNERRGREGVERGGERGEFRALEEAEAELPVVVKENPEKPAWLKEKEFYEKKRKG